MPAGGKHVAQSSPEQLCDAPSRVPGHDVVLLAAYRIGVLADAAQIDRLALQPDRAGLDQVVLDVGVAQVPAVRSPGHARAVTVPVQQVEGGRLVAKKIVV